MRRINSVLSEAPKIRRLIPEIAQSGAEIIENIVSGRAFRLEVIHSSGDSSGSDFWYDQETVEWVALVHGNATLEFEDGALELTAGDSLIIEAHQKHRVASTSMDAVWIALHYDLEEQTSKS